MTNFLPWTILAIKGIFLVLLFFYLVFSYVVLTKVRLLSQVLKTEVETFLVLLAVANITAALMLLLLGLFLL